MTIVAVSGMQCSLYCITELIHCIYVFLMTTSANKFAHYTALRVNYQRWDCTKWIFFSSLMLVMFVCICLYFSYKQNSLHSWNYAISVCVQRCTDKHRLWVIITLRSVSPSSSHHKTSLHSLGDSLVYSSVMFIEDSFSVIARALQNSCHTKKDNKNK